MSTDPVSIRARDPCGRWAGKLGHTFDFFPPNSFHDGLSEIAHVGFIQG